jgi:hypothetical protein
MHNFVGEGIINMPMFKKKTIDTWDQTNILFDINSTIIYKNQQIYIFSYTIQKNQCKQQMFEINSNSSLPKNIFENIPQQPGKTMCIAFS